MPRNVIENRQSLDAEFKRCGLPLTAEELDRFWKLHELLTLKNPEGDLTRVSGFYNILYKHYIDGAAAAKMIEPTDGLLMDLGTGAGFPGLPVAIRRPDLRLLLAEPRGRRLAFMEEAADLLGLTNVEFYPHKVGPRFDRAIAGFMTRDFESVAASLERGAAIVPQGGRVILLKGAAVNAELSEARGTPTWRDFRLVSDQAYALGESGLKRRLLTFCKTSPTRISPPAHNEKIVEIGSRENARYKAWLKLLEGRGVRKSGEALISGRKFVQEILERYPERASGLIARRADDFTMPFALPPQITLHLLRPELFPALDIYNSRAPLLVLEAPKFPDWPGTLEPGLTLFLPLSDPGNLGTAIRSAAALGHSVVLLKEAASPWHPKALRAAGPAILAAKIFEGPALAELPAAARAAGLCLKALSARGENIFTAELPETLGLCVGVEGPGLDAHWPPSARLSIPMNPAVESLNAAAALAVALGVFAARLSITSS